MIIACPSCGKRYQLADSAIGPEGRKVRCAACGETWHATRPEPAPEPAP
ncbi:MAG: zinc-ribbon domain-containing protein, partial [Alphaproteobacteria bacterium]|nr:zinc-ribbon domain-containing protein [Alphaproteobacteria bacterium]